MGSSGNETDKLVVLVEERVEVIVQAGNAPSDYSMPGSDGEHLPWQETAGSEHP